MKSEREQQCSVTTDLTHLGNVWTDAIPPTLKKGDRIYGLLGVLKPGGARISVIDGQGIAT